MFRLPSRVTVGSLLRACFAAHPWLWAGAALAYFVGSVVDTAYYYPVKLVTDAMAEGATDDGVHRVLWLVALMALLSFIEITSWRLSDVFSAHGNRRQRAELPAAMLRYVQQHSHRYFSDSFAGAIGSKVGQLASALESLVSWLVFDLWGSIISIVVGLVLLLQTGGWVAVSALVSAVVLCLYMWSIRKAYARFSAAIADARAKASGQTVDSITNIRAVRLEAMATWEQEQVRLAYVGYAEAAYQQFLYFSWRRYLLGAIIHVSTLSMVLITVWLWGEGRATVGDIALVFGVGSSFVSTVRNFLMNTISTVGDYATAKEIVDTLFTPHDIVDAPDARALQVPAGALALDGVQFAYGDKTVLHGISLDIPAGQKVGIVGRSGAGKTTLMQLLLREWELTGGSISIDGQDINQVTQDSLRRAIAVVPQEPMLFHRSLRDNIRYARPAATDAEVEEVARLAAIHDDIVALKDGYDTLVGERGVKLSGGQRQRVAIARALLKDAPIVLLDEATSALDSESEQLIQAALVRLFARKTVLVVAHRLSTLRHLQRIVVLDAGRIAEDGTHEQLLAAGGIYAQLWARQAGGFLGDK